jgi:redox-sensitive bicupin YhaK (pirin superfamily)
VELGAGGELALALPTGHTCAVVVLTGRATVNGSAPLDDAEMALLSLEGERVVVRAEKKTLALVLRGAPLGDAVLRTARS